jgi:dTDP-4-amino-4,6-dideoxygalactose transaminase
MKFQISYDGAMNSDRAEQIFPLVRPDIAPPESWTGYLVQAYKDGIYSNSGNIWKQLNVRVESYFPRSKAIGVANNTVGQIAALQAVGIKGELVFLSNFTFPATLQAVILAGGIPVLCDCDPETWEISVATVKAAYGEFGKPKVILLTRVFGKREDVSELFTFAALEGIDFLLDSAAAFPTSPIEDDIGVMNEVFSLHATKALGVGEGGLIVGNFSFIEETWKRCNFGIMKNNTFTDGSNAKMDEFTAARALAALDRYEKTSANRRNFVTLAYESVLEIGNYSKLTNIKSLSWSLFPLKFDSEIELLRFEKFSKSRGLAGKRYYFPSMLDGYVGTFEIHRASTLEQSQQLSKLIYCLPVYSTFLDEEVMMIRSIVQDSLQYSRQRSSAT